MRMTFEEVAIRDKKSGKCKCGKRRTRSQKFYQTINPFNTDAHGVPKDRRTIVAELLKEAAKWKRQPITCPNCEGKR